MAKAEALLDNLIQGYQKERLKDIFDKHGESIALRGITVARSVEDIALVGAR